MINNDSDAAIRLGLALYRRTILYGDSFYSLYDIVFEDIEAKTRKSTFEKLFSTRDKNFWATQEELVRVLENSGIARAQRRQVFGHGGSDYFVQITPLGRAIFSLASLQTKIASQEIDGLHIEDVALVLRRDDDAQELSVAINNLHDSIDALGLSNYQRATVNSYSNILVSICAMPDRDVKLFWSVLERLNNFAGVASLIVALIALRLAR